MYLGSTDHASYDSFCIAIVGFRFFYHLGLSDSLSDLVLPFLYLAFTQFLPSRVLLDVIYGFTIEFPAHAVGGFRHYKVAQRL